MVNKLIKIISSWFIYLVYMLSLVSISGLIGIYGVQLKWFIYNGCPYKSGSLIAITACQSEWNITLGVVSACAGIAIYIMTHKQINKLIERIRR